MTKNNIMSELKHLYCELNNSFDELPIHKQSQIIDFNKSFKDAYRSPAKTKKSDLESLYGTALEIRNMKVIKIY